MKSLKLSLLALVASCSILGCTEATPEPPAPAPAAPTPAPADSAKSKLAPTPSTAPLRD